MFALQLLEAELHKLLCASQFLCKNGLHLCCLATICQAGQDGIAELLGWRASTGSRFHWQRAHQKPLL